MPADPRALTAELTAELCIAEVAKRSSLGVFVEHMPSLDPAVFLTRISKGVAKPIRVAVLGTARPPTKAPANVSLTSSPTEANQWRNDDAARRGTKFITLVMGAAAKLNSLRSAVTPLGPDQLRAAAVSRAIALLDTPERRAFWTAVANRRELFAVDAILEFLASITGASKSTASMLEAESTEVWRLSLLRQEGLFSANGARSAAANIRRNRELVARLRAIPSKERANVVRIAEETSDTDRLKAIAQGILAYEATEQKDALATLDYDNVIEVLKAAPENDKENGNGGPKKPRQRLEGDTLAVDLLIEADGRGIKAAAKRFRTELDPDADGDIEPDEINVGSRKVLPRLKTGTRQVTGTFARVLDAEQWGGVVNAPTAKDFVGALKLLSADEAEVATFRPANKDNVRDMLNRAVSQAWVDKDVLRAWDKYASARNALLPHIGPLADHPLMALAGDSALVGKAEKLLAAYDDVLAAIKTTSEALKKHGSNEAAKRLLARALVLDLLFVRTANETSGIAAPTHPFHLWRWVTLANLLTDRTQELKELGADVLRDLVTEPPPVSPSIMLSPFVVEAHVERSSPFVCVGSFGALPLFAEPSARNLGKFKARPLAKVALRFLRLMPHAAFGLRLALVDPLSITGTLEELFELDSPFRDEHPVTLHVTVFRTRAGLDATEEEDEDLEEISRNVHDWGGSISVVVGPRTPAQIAQELAKNPAHLTVVFQPGEGQTIRVGLSTAPMLSPLVVPRAYRYDEFDDRLDVIVAGEGAPFMTYYEVFREALDLPSTDFVGRRSGASRQSHELSEYAKASVWCTVVDQAVEPTLRIGDAMRLDWRSESGRDIVTFTSRPETIAEVVIEAIRQAGLVPTPATVRRTFEQVQRLSGEALLALARMSDGTLIEARVAKGTLGVIAAARWYERTHPDALMISLDDSYSRRWILGHADTDNRHGDLVAVRLSNDGVVVDAVEVKTYDDEAAGLTIKGASVEGKGATQVDQTIKILRKLLAPAADELSPLDRARRDILRDHLYRAVASRPYQSDQRGRLVRLLDELFRSGTNGLSGLIFKVTIASNTAEVLPISPKFYRTPGGNQLGIVEIVETEASGPPHPKSGEGSGGGPSGGGPGTPRSSEGTGVGKPNRAKKGRTFDAKMDSSDEPSEAGGAPAAIVGVAPSMDNPKVLLGVSNAEQQVFWEPQRPDAPLNNFGILVTGDSGSGKTQILRAIIAEVAALGFPVCIFDFKNDYGAAEFSGTAKLRVYDVSRGGVPFNPLSLLADEHGEAQPITQIHTLAGILRRIFNLGDQQESRLKKAMARAYEEEGVDPKTRYKVDQIKSAPSFEDVVKLLEEDEKNEPLLNRLSPLFDLGLFPSSGAVKTTFEALIKERVVLDLHSLPDDRIKAAVAEFMIVRLHGYMLRGEQPRKLRRLMVFDEAWRVKDSERLQELAREGRAFGVGIAIGTQFPGDIRDNLAGNLATQIFLHNKEAEHQKSIARALVGAPSGPKASHIIGKVATLQKHEGFVRNQQHSPYVLIRTTPHYERLTK